ncbi:hypothetical protein ERJ75_000909700 [Trypanosoma vivax]|nr:hypothetical protein ERJ75_000909700 [Trypanosoma vivax]
MRRFATRTRALKTGVGPTRDKRTCARNGTTVDASGVTLADAIDANGECQKPSASAPQNYNANGSIAAKHFAGTDSAACAKVLTPSRVADGRPKVRRRRCGAP